MVYFVPMELWVSGRNHQPALRSKTDNLNMIRKILLLFVFTIAFGSGFRVDAKSIVKAQNPVNVAVIVAEKTSPQDMVSFCEYYGLTRDSSDGNDYVFVAEDDSEIRFTSDSGNQASKGKSVVEVFTKSSVKSAIKSLEQCGYYRVKDAEKDSSLKDCIIYEKGSRFLPTRMRCVIKKDNPCRLSFSRLTAKTF